MCYIHRMKIPTHELEFRTHQWNSNPPTCANINCENKCAYARKTVQGFNVWRAFCNQCHIAHYKRCKKTGKAHLLAKGVKSIKKGRCSNTDCRLGFKCKARKGKPFSYPTDIDHIDGNRLNNKLTNLQELCRDCHTRKGSENKDFSRRNKIKMTSAYGVLQKHFDSGLLKLE